MYKGEYGTTSNDVDITLSPETIVRVMSGLGKFTALETMFLGLVLEGFCYGKVLFCSERAVADDYSCPGLYSAIFCVYIQYHVSQELGIQIDKRNVFLYLLCILYLLSTATIILQILPLLQLAAIPNVSKSWIITFLSIYTRLFGQISKSSSNEISLQPLALHLFYVLSTINGLCDFISQAILVSINL